MTEMQTETKQCSRNVNRNRRMWPNVNRTEA